MRFKEYLITEGKVAETFDTLSKEKGTNSYAPYILVAAKKAEHDDIGQSLKTLIKGPDFGLPKTVHDGDYIARILQFGSHEAKDPLKSQFLIKREVFILFREAEGTKEDAEGYSQYEMMGDTYDVVDDGSHFYLKQPDKDVVTKMPAQLFQKRFKLVH